MRNKIISILLILSLLNTNLFAILDEGNSTKGGKWTDPTTGMKYYSGGKKHYSFKKRVNSFTPWMKIRPPSIKAGCGGISLDGGFASFINLEEIGKQLEEAMSSIGMGVIVVLIQTLPSIGKAFEDIQKMVKKFQELLQNACQMTVTALSSMPQVAETQKEWQEGVDSFLGNNWMAKQAKGATEAMENFEKSIDCGGSPTSECLQNQAMKSLGLGSDYVVKGSTISEFGDKTLKGIFNNANQEAGKFTVSEFKDLIEDGKFNNKAIQGFDEASRNMFKLKAAIFGILATPYDSSLRNKVKEGEDSVEIKEASKAFAEGKANVLKFMLNHYPALNSIEEIQQFFSYEEIDKDNTFKLKVPTYFNTVTITLCSSSTAEGGCQGNKNHFGYFEAWQEINDEADYIEIEWKGIHKSTRENILHYIDPKKYNKPTDNVGLFVPGMDKYLDIVRDAYVANNKNLFTIYDYIDFLTARNVAGALSSLANEIEGTMSELTARPDDPNEAAKTLYLANAKAVLGFIKKTIEELPEHYINADSVLLFNELEKRNKAKRTNMAQ